MTETMPTISTKRRGPPARNQNAVSSGLSMLAGSGRVPTKIRGGIYIRRQVRKLRREAINEFVAIHGRDPSIHEHIALKTLARAEARAMLHERMLANDWDILTFEQRTTSLDKIGAAGDQEIRCSKELGLNRQPGDDADAAKWLAIPVPDDDAPQDDETAVPGQNGGDA